MKKLLLIFFLLSALLLLPQAFTAAENGAEETLGLEPDELVQQEFTKYRKVAYLTFDDGPSSNTIPILDILDKYRIKATFFVMASEGPYADKAYREMIKRGHVIALHTHTHDYSKIYRSKDAFFDDIHDLETFLKSKYSITSEMIRFPGGSKNHISRQVGGRRTMEAIIRETKKRGYRFYDWNVDSTDGISPNVSEQTIIRSVLQVTPKRQNAFILLHDIHNMKNTVRALPEIIEGLRKQGFEFDVIKRTTPDMQFN